MPLLSDYPQLKIIQDIAKRRKVPIYLVGGFLRDFLLGEVKNDFDFAVKNNALHVARIFSKEIKGAYVLLDEARGCARVAKNIGDRLYTFDFADFREKTFDKDLAHRDFTINTLSIDLSKVDQKTEIPDVLIDRKSGLKDIKSKRIKRVSAAAFKEDPLRMMRAFSLKAMLDFTIESKTLNQIRKEKDLICHVSYERIRDELFKILETDKSASVVKSMDRAGLLEQIIPQVKVMFGCRQGTYHHLDVWPHSMETVVQLEKIFNELKGNSEIESYLKETLGGNRSRRALVKLAALLHDIGKPDTRRKEKGRTSFHGHEHAGKAIVKNIARTLKLSVREGHALEDMVRWHLRPGYLSNFKQPTEKAIYRYFRDTKEESVSTVLLSLADQRATRGPATTPKDQKHHEEICLDLIQRCFLKKQEKPFRRFINGDDLIRQLRLKSSPVFGKILAEVEERQMLGKLKSKKEAIECAKAIAAKIRQSKAGQ
ncbi:MAG: HD domain-containing protein [Candidatus Omnitrophica bacterium]|nr:HD domain-containing protein [Candidatus Omnitrophota bacterium]